MIRGLSTCSLFVAAMAGTACSSSCPREDEETSRQFTGGITNAERTVYQTNRWDQGFIDFPAGRRLALVHGLRDTPVELKSYLGFKAGALPEGERGFAAESAGNQVLIEGVDSETIRVRNDSCEHFYLRLVASTVPFTGSEGGAGGEGGAP